MVIKLYFIFILYTTIVYRADAGNLLMHYFNNLFIEDKLFIENISSNYSRQIVFFFRKNNNKILLNKYIIVMPH